MNVRYIRVFDMQQEEITARLQDILPKGLQVLPCDAPGETLLTAQAESENALLPLLIETRLRLGKAVYAIDAAEGGSLAATTVHTLRQRGWTCASCESLTGGLIAATLVEVPGASEVVRGGLITYQTDTKTLLAGVPAKVIEAHDVVSAEVAMAMAEGTRTRLGVDIAVSATGLAGPGGGTPEKPVGTVFLGISTARGSRAIPLHLTGDRMAIRRLTVQHALNTLRLEALQ